MGVAVVDFAVCFKIRMLRYVSNRLNMTYTQQNDTGSYNKNVCYYRGTQRQFSENICSEDDLRPRILGTPVVKFLMV